MIRFGLVAWLACVSGCGARTIADDSQLPRIDGDSGVAPDSASTDADAEPPYSPGRIAALAEACRGSGNVISLEGVFVGTIRPSYFDTGTRSRYVRVETIEDPSATIELSTDGLGEDLESKLYPNAVALWPDQPGHPGMAITFRSSIILGDGWFRILDIEWTDASKDKLSKLDAVFEQWEPEGASPRRNTYGCVHYQKP